MLLAPIVDARDAVETALDGAEHRCEEGALAFEHARHVAAKRHHDRGEDHEIDGDLNAAVEGHGAPLEFLRPQQRVGQVDEQYRGDDAGEPVVKDHDGLLQTVAGDSVGDRQREEAEADYEKDEIEHLALLQKRAGAEPSRGVVQRRPSARPNVVRAHVCFRDGAEVGFIRIS